MSTLISEAKVGKNPYVSEFELLQKTNARMYIVVAKGETPKELAI